MDPNELFGGMENQSFNLSPSSLEEDFDDSGMMSDGDSVEQMDSAAGPRRKNRRLPSTAEKRANHNAIERARRESLNGKFMELARALPTMAVVKRPSKNSIVIKSLEFVKGARIREQALEAENADLRKEVNELRAKLGMKAREVNVPTTVVSQAPSIPAIKKEKTPAASPAAVVTPKPVASVKPAAAAAAAAVAAKPAAVARKKSAPVVTSTTGPYLGQDLLAAPSTYYGGFIDPFASTAVKVDAGSPHPSTSDSESSLVHTPPSYHSFGNGPALFMEEMVHAPFQTTTTFDNDFLAQCGLASSMPTMPTWGATNVGIGALFGAPAASSGFPLFA